MRSAVMVSLMLCPDTFFEQRTQICRADVGMSCDIIQAYQIQDIQKLDLVLGKVQFGFGRIWFCFQDQYVKKS